MTYVDLNSDLGESFGSYTIGQDKEVISYISSANIACGWHAGDPLVMARTVQYAKEAGIAIGAHPGFHDLEGFGRRKMIITPEEARCYIQYQLGALMAFAQAQGLKVQHVKPHGALYNMAAVDPALSLAIAEGIKAVDSSIILLGLANSEMLKAAEKVGIPCASEVFADRAYMDDGTLSPRSMPGSVIHDKQLAIARTVTMVKEGYVESINGKKIAIQADSICVHGDNADAITFTAGIREALTKEGITIAPLTKVLEQKSTCSSIENQ